MEYYLAHHGIKGQKWGVRRYQNPDGSLTDAGRRKAAKDAYRSVKRDIRKSNAAASKEYRRKLGDDVYYGRISSGESYRRSSNESTLRYQQGKSKRLAAKAKMNSELSDLSKNKFSKGFRDFKSAYESNRSEHYSERAKQTNKMINVTNKVYHERLNVGERFVGSYILNTSAANSYYSNRANASMLEAAGRTLVSEYMKTYGIRA